MSRDLNDGGGSGGVVHGEESDDGEDNGSDDDDHRGGGGDDDDDNDDDDGAVSTATFVAQPPVSATGDDMAGLSGLPTDVASARLAYFGLAPPSAVAGEGPGGSASWVIRTSFGALVARASRGQAVGQTGFQAVDQAGFREGFQTGGQAGFQMGVHAAHDAGAIASVGASGDQAMSASTSAAATSLPSPSMPLSALPWSSPVPPKPPPPAPPLALTPAPLPAAPILAAVSVALGDLLETHVVGVVGEVQRALAARGVLDVKDLARLHEVSASASGAALLREGLAFATPAPGASLKKKSTRPHLTQARLAAHQLSELLDPSRMVVGSSSSCGEHPRRTINTPHSVAMTFDL
jgi:hypothetical protein